MKTILLECEYLGRVHLLREIFMDCATLFKFYRLPIRKEEW